MADLSITAANVLPVSQTTGAYGGTIPLPTYNAGEAISAGDLVYELTTTDGTPSTWKKAQCDNGLSSADSKVQGMALNSAATGQPVAVGKGQITIGTGFTVGMQVNLSAAAGKAAPVADIATTNNVIAVGCIVGTGASSAAVGTNGTDILLIVTNYTVLHV